MDQFTVSGASLATEPPKHGLADGPFDKARAFQNRVVEWVHDDETPVAVARAPTGAGKTVTFHELIETQRLTLLVYPTNALLRQQRNRFDSDAVNAAILNGQTLEGHGDERTENLLAYLNEYVNDHDVVLTNPDILQAVIQDLYRGDHAMEFFDKFDAVVYDEFHFYGSLAASGLLLQTKIIAERSYSPKILLASATPNEDFVEFVRTQLRLDIQDIQAEYVETGDQFRQPIEVTRHEDRRIMDDREAVAELLQAELDPVPEYDDPQVVLTFNSAKDSNDFHDFLAEKYPTVFEHTEKDNGFDTNDEQVDLDEETFYILNTTSKGEVGLDYDVTTLIMENPTRPSAFIQRFGRAGRVSEASVHVYGLGQGPWSDNVGFPTFVKQVYEGLQDEEMFQSSLADLVGFRGAYGIAVREDAYRGFNPEIYEDLATDVEQYSQWHDFIEDVEKELEKVGALGGYQESSSVAKLLRFTKECFKAFRGLRGRSLQAQIEYPRGDRVSITTYDISRTLRHYDIDHVREENVLAVEPRPEDSPAVVTARLPGYDKEPTPYNDSTSEIESRLQDKIHRDIDKAAQNDDFGVSKKLLHRFFDIVRITDAIVPETLTTTTHEITVDDEGSGPPTIDVERRQV